MVSKEVSCFRSGIQSKVQGLGSQNRDLFLSKVVRPPERNFSFIGVCLLASIYITN